MDGINRLDLMIGKRLERLQNRLTEMFEIKLKEQFDHHIDDIIGQGSHQFNDRELSELLHVLEHPESEMLRKYFINKIKLLMR